MDPSVLKALVMERLQEVTSRAGVVRVLLLVFGVVLGMSAVSAAITIGQGARALFSDLERAVREPERFEIEPSNDRFSESLLDTLQARVPGARLCPIMEAPGRAPGIADGDIQVIGLDFLGDTRLPLIRRWMSPGTLQKLVVPTVYVPRRILDASPELAGRAIELHVNGRYEVFVVAEVPLPDDFVSRSAGARVVVDVAHFQAAFRPDGGVDRIAVLTTGNEGRRRAETELVGALPAGARLLALGGGSRIASAWIATWRRTASLLVSAAFLLGVVILYLSATAAYARLGPVTRRLGKTRRERLAVAASEVAEVGSVATFAAVLGVLNGWVLIDTLSSWAVGIGPWEAITPLGGDRPPILPLTLAFAMGLGLPTVFALLSRLEITGRRDVLIEIPRAPAAGAGVLFVIASVLTMPGVGLGNLGLGYAAALLVCIAMGLLGRPFLALAGRLLKRHAVGRWPVGARVIAAQLIETPTAVGVSLALVAFTLASTAALSGVASHLGTLNDEWVDQVFGADVRLEAPSGTSALPQLLPAAFESAIRQSPEVIYTSVIRDVQVTLSGTILPFTLVSPDRLQTLDVSESASQHALEQARSASPPLVPLYLPERMALAYSLAPGAHMWIDTETGSWQCLVAGTYRPRFAMEPACLANAHDFLDVLTLGKGVSSIDVRFRAGTDARSGRDAIRAAIGPGASVRIRPFDVPRPHVERAFHVARRAVTCLLGVLAALTAAAFFSFAGGALVDIPAAWRVMAALGVSRRRIATSAAVGLTALGLVGMLIGGLVGVSVAGALTGAVSTSAIGRPPGGVELAPYFWPASVFAWAIASWLAFVVTRSRVFQRAIEGGVR